jgi:hypothetical protein
MCVIYDASSTRKKEPDMRKAVLMVLIALGLMASVAPASYAGGGPPGNKNDSK